MRGCSLDTCVACTWLDLMSSSAIFQDSVICADFWSRQYGPHTACDRLRWRWPCLPRLRWFDPLLLRCAWWSSGLGWLLNLSLAGTYVGAFLYWTLAVLEAGLTSHPLLALPRLLSTTWLVVSTAAPMASCDRHSVALALSSSL